MYTKIYMCRHEQCVYINLWFLPKPQGWGLGWWCMHACMHVCMHNSPQNVPVWHPPGSSQTVRRHATFDILSCTHIWICICICIYIYMYMQTKHQCKQKYNPNPASQPSEQQSKQFALIKHWFFHYFVFAKLHQNGMYVPIRSLFHGKMENHSSTQPNLCVNNTFGLSSCNNSSWVDIFYFIFAEVRLLVLSKEFYLVFYIKLLGFECLFIFFEGQRTINQSINQSINQ